MIRTFEQRHSAGGIARPCGGGGGGSSSSSTATTTTTNNTDKRIVADNGASVASLDGNGNSVSIVQTDQGAIQGAGQIALASITNNSTNLNHLLATADHLLSQQQQGMQTAADLTKTLAGTAQTAYSDAANQASGNKQLILAAMAVVGVVAFTSLKK